MHECTYMCFRPCNYYKIDVLAVSNTIESPYNDIAGVWSPAREGVGAEDNPGPNESQSNAGATD